VNKKEDNALKAEVYSEKRVGAEKIIQWVSSDNTTIKVQVIGELLNPDKTFNENSLMVKEGFAEKTVELLNEGDIIQFERFGFCRLDNKAGMEFIFISR
jgi:glutamyl-tRNA synthetase